RRAVTLDQPAAQRDLVTECPVGMQTSLDAIEPRFDHHLLFAIPRTVRAQPAQPGKQTQHQQSAYTMRSNLERKRAWLPASRLAAFVPGDQTARESRRHQSSDLGDAWLEMIVDTDDFARLCLHLAAHPHPARSAALEVRHVHDVVEHHPEC